MIHVPMPRESPSLSLAASYLIQRQNYAASAVSVFNLRVSLDFWRFAVPFLITPLQAALSKRLATFLHNSCAVSTLPSSSAISVCLSNVRSVALRCLLRMRFVSSARACFLADCRCKTYPPLRTYPLDNLIDNRAVKYPSQCVYLMIPQNIGFVYFFYIGCQLSAVSHWQNNTMDWGCYGNRRD